MDFHLSFKIPAFTQKINYSQKLLFIGSCFAENIGELMQRHKFNVLTNPNGIIYNPISISAVLNNVIGNNVLKEDDLFFANECWNSWEHHSKFSNTDKQNCLTTINNNIAFANTFLKESDWLFITFGSAFVYRLNNTGQIVSNCHKIPQKEFTRHLLEVNEIVTSHTSLINNLKKFNPHLKVVFTVSPVRYIRDGVVENTLSKARLIEAAHQLTKLHDTVFYFPAYELVIDDLRDYRFYKRDMVHPNEQAIEYVFEKLMNTLFEEGTQVIFEKIKNIINAKHHKPFNANTEAHQKFKTSYVKLCNELLKECPSINLSEELAIFTN